MFKGLRTIIYQSVDIDADKAFWTKALGFGPYFDQPYYVGFNVGGYELGLDPNGSAEGNMAPVVYWGVDEIGAAVSDLISRGVQLKGEIKDVGEGIRVATFLDNAGNAFGLIENPNFRLVS